MHGNMKLLFIILIVPFVGYSQPGIVVVGDTIKSFDPNTGVYTQLTKTVPTMSGQSGKVLSTNGTTYTWLTPFDGAWSSISGKPATFTATAHTHTISEISNFGTYANVSDTAAMLLKYLRKQDTTTMLSPYVRSNVASATYQPIGTYATGSGSASGTNTGDNAVNSLYSSLVSNVTHTGDATGSTALTVVKINGTSLAGLATGILKNTTTTGVPSIAAQADVTALLGAGSISNTMLANAAVANLSGTNTGDQTITLTGDVTGSGTGSFATTIGAAKVTNAMLAGSIAASKLIGTDIATLAKNTSYNGVTSVSNGLSQVVATIDATAQVANIATATLYAVPSAGFYRVSIYITVTSVGTTSTMPSTTITYTDGNAGTNAHSTTTTATSTGNSITTTFAQTTYVLYAKASTNIQYATGSYASTGTPMQYALRIKLESL